MSYTVEEVKGPKGSESKYIVLDNRFETVEHWIFEAYLLNIETNEENDIVLPFAKYLVENFPSVRITRGSIIDSKRSCFTGLSYLEIAFLDKDEAQGYATVLNKSTRTI